jgi:hypothetical protein
MEAGSTWLLVSECKEKSSMDAPQNPAGEFVAEENYGPQRRAEFIQTIAAAPAALRQATAGLSAEQLDGKYRNWAIRQIAHHLADSHLHSYIRFKWALTEETPTIKAYDEGRWAALADSRAGDIQPALALYESLHGRWVELMRTMTEEQFERSFHHPETNKDVSLNAALCYYAWHSRHHTAQSEWVRKQRGW